MEKKPRVVSKVEITKVVDLGRPKRWRDDNSKLSLEELSKRVPHICKQCGRLTERGSDYCKYCITAVCQRDRYY